MEGVAWIDGIRWIDGVGYIDGVGLIDGVGQTEKVSLKARRYGDCIVEKTGSLGQFQSLRQSSHTHIHSVNHSSSHPPCHQSSQPPGLFHNPQTLSLNILYLRGRTDVNIKLYLGDRNIKVQSIDWRRSSGAETGSVPSFFIFTIKSSFPPKLTNYRHFRGEHSLEDRRHNFN